MRKSSDSLEKDAAAAIKASRLVGPEDLRAGQYVTIAETTYEVLCMPDELGCAGGVAVAEPQIAHVTGWTSDAGWPVRILEVCLPFAFAETARGQHVAIDLRRHRVSRLSKAYGRKAFEAVRKTQATS